MTGLRVIGRFYDPEEAHVALGYLRANGFDALLADSGMLMMNPTHRIALGGFRIMAPDHEAGEAQGILIEARDRPNGAASPCAVCGGADYRRVKTWWFPLAFLVLFGTIVPFATNSRYLECRTCKTRICRSSASEGHRESHQTHP